MSAFECVIPGCRAATEHGVCDECMGRMPLGTSTRDQALRAAAFDLRKGLGRAAAAPGHTDTGKQLEAADGPQSDPGNPMEARISELAENAARKVTDWLMMERQR